MGELLEPWVLCSIFLIRESIQIILHLRYHFTLPINGYQHLQGIVGESFYPFPGLPTETLQGMIGKFWNVVFPLPEGREEERKHIQPVEKVFPETPLIYHGLKIFVGSRNNPGIRFLCVTCTYRFVLAHLQNPQEFSLDLQTQIRHIVQKKSPAVSYLEDARFVFDLYFISNFLSWKGE